MRRWLYTAFLNPFYVMCLYDNVLENNEIVIYVCDLAIGPSAQLCRVLHAETYCESHVTTHICFHSYILVSKSGNICGERQRLCLERVDMEVDSKLLGGPRLFIVGGIQFQVETYHWIRVAFSTSLLIDKLEELQCTNMQPTISSLSAIL